MSNYLILIVICIGFLSIISLIILSDAQYIYGFEILSDTDERSIPRNMLTSELNCRWLELHLLIDHNGNRGIETIVTITGFEREPD